MGDMGTATVLAVAIRDTGTMPFQSTDAGHTDIRTDTDTATDMTLDTGIWVTQGGTQTTMRMFRILLTTIAPIQHGRIHLTAMAYSSHMAGEILSSQRKLWRSDNISGRAFRD